MLLCMEGALHASIDFYNTTWPRHLKLKVSVVQDCIETGESSSSKQCMIATAEGDDVEDQVFASEVVRRTEEYFLHYGPCTTGLDAGYHSFKGGFSGLDS